MSSEGKSGNSKIALLMRGLRDHGICQFDSAVKTEIHRDDMMSVNAQWGGALIDMNGPLETIAAQLLSLKLVAKCRAGCVAFCYQKGPGLDL